MSDEFEKFITKNGVEHRKTTPLWPQANAEVPSDCTSGGEGLAYGVFQIADSLQIHTASYHGDYALLHMFGPQMRSKLPELRPETIDVTQEEVRHRDWAINFSDKGY